MDEFISEFVSVLRGSSAIAVPSPAKTELPQHNGFYRASADRWMQEMQETVRISRDRRKGVIHDDV